jgi:hypothetical protein
MLRAHDIFCLTFGGSPNEALTCEKSQQENQDARLPDQIRIGVVSILPGTPRTWAVKLTSYSAKN